MNFTGPAEDRLAIRELCDQYAAAVMARDRQMMADVLAEDAERTRFGETTRGREALVAQSGETMDAFAVGALFLNPGSIHVEGSRARGRSYQAELLFFADGPRWFLSYYDDEYVKRDGRWFIQKRVLTLMQKGAFPPPPDDVAAG